MRWMILLLAIGGCTAAGDCPETLYWQPLTCRCHSAASGGFVDTGCCIKDGVNLDACPLTEE